MTDLLDGLQLVCVVYPLTAVLNLRFGLGSAMIPWWLWGIIIALAFISNRRFLCRTRSMMGIILFNVFFGLLSGVTPVIILQMFTSARWWPGVCPGIAEIVLIWSAVCVYLFIEPLSPKDRMRLLEISLVLMSVLAVAKQYFSLRIPFFWLGIGSFLFIGLFREAAAHSEGLSSRQYPGCYGAGTPFLFTVFFMSIGVCFGWLLAADRFTRFLNNAIQACVQFKSFIVQIFQITGLDKNVEPSKILPKIFSGTPVETYNDFGSTAPLWVMIILWTILAVLLIFIIIQGAFGLRNIFRTFLVLKRSLSYDRKENGIFRIWRKRQKKQLVHIFKYFLRHFKLFARKWLFLSPWGVKNLYYFFLRWGQSNNMEKTAGETPQEYLDRLWPLLKEAHPQIADALADLTANFYVERYQGAAQIFSEEKIYFIARGLKTIKLNQVKQAK
jgi:hypothetical protein